MPTLWQENLSCQTKGMQLMWFWQDSKAEEKTLRVFIFISTLFLSKHFYNLA